MPGLIEELTAQLGASGVIAPEAGAHWLEPADYPAWLIDSRAEFEGRALAVARPSTLQETVEIVKICQSRGVPIVPQGGNTGRVAGSIPQKDSLLVRMDRMNRLRTIDAEAGFLIAEAGCILSSIQEAAVSVERHFPLSLGSQASCMIGGNLASNAGGVHVLRYGNCRDLTLGIEAVLPDGSVFSSLNGLRKDNSGYDLKHLFIGSEGTLGLITAASLRLFPPVKAHSAALLAIEDMSNIKPLFARASEELGLYLEAFEVMSAAALDLVKTHMPAVMIPMAAEHPWIVLIELGGATPETDDLSARLTDFLAKALEDDLISDATLSANDQQRQSFWALRDAIPAAEKKEGIAVKQDISVPLNAVIDYHLEAAPRLEKILPGLRIIAFGHFGDGNWHYNLLPPQGMSEKKFQSCRPALAQTAVEIALSFGGSFAAEHGVGQVKRDWMRNYKDPVALSLMQKIKQTLDPQNIMNPGKLLPDINESPQSGD